MTLIELLVFLFDVGVGIAAARWLHPVGGWWLAVPGSAVGVATLPLTGTGWLFGAVGGRCTIPRRATDGT